MANYFSKFPKLYHSFDNYKTTELVVNLVTRFSIEQSLKDNSSIFYEYDIRDGDTPEIIASKIYGSPERHWIVLLFNDVINPYYDWPLQYDTLINYIDKKYLTNANSTTTGDGVIWSKSNVHSYYRVENCVAPDGTTTVQKYQIDANTYANTIVSLNNTVTVAGNNIVTFNTTKEIKSYYDFELQENESKRTIKLLKPEFVATLEKELENIA